jgi:hypothetical protein
MAFTLDNDDEVINVHTTKALGAGKADADYFEGVEANDFRSAIHLLRDHTRGWVNVKSHGAKGDGTTDDTAAIQAAIGAAKTSGKRFVFIPPGIYRVTSISLRGVEGFTFGGSGAGSDRPNGHVTMLRSIGASAGKPMLDLTGSNSVSLRDLHVWGESAAKPSVGVVMSRPPPAGTANSGGHLFTNVMVSGFFTEAAVVSLSSEVNKYIDCTFQNAEPGGAAFWTESGNVMGLVSDHGEIPVAQSGGNTGFTFLSVHFLTMPEFPSGTESAVKGTFTNASWTSCYTNTNGKAAFEITGGLSNSSIITHRDESSAGVGLYAAGPVTKLSVLSSRLGQLWGQNGVLFDDLTLASDITWNALPDPPGPWALNVDILKNSRISWTNNTKIRTTAHNNDLGTTQDGFALSLPADAHGNVWRQEVTSVGGYADPVRELRFNDADPRTHVHMNRLTAAKFLTKPQAIVASAVPGFTLNPLDFGGGMFVTVTVDHWLDILSISADATWEPGARLTLLFRQDGTGGHNVNFPANFEMRGWSVDTAANAVSVMTFVADPVSNKWVAESLGRPAAAQADSAAADTAGIVADFNALLAKLRTAGLLAP